MKTRVHITTLVNKASIRKEVRNGRDVIYVSSATLPDDVVMNDVMYPADEIEKSFKSLENTFAPLGHPHRNGQFLSAFDPEAINGFHIGAFNVNVRRDKGRVLIDKVIDVEVANRTEAGKRVLAAVDKGEPIHTSTGLYAIMEAANGDVPYKQIARDIVFDHDAILLDEDGAATPEQGVGMLVNAKGETEQVTVINSTFEEEADREIDWAITNLAQAVQRKENASKLSGIKAKLLSLFGIGQTTNQKDDDAMPVTDEQFSKLTTDVANIGAAVNKLVTDLPGVVNASVETATKGLNDTVTAMNAAQKTKDEAELTGLRAKIVGAKLLSEAAANSLSLEAARELAPKAKPGSAANLTNALGEDDDGDADAYALPN
jgi:hypothetical protein